MSEETTNPNTQTSASDETSVDLTLNDLAALRSIIDVASSRGAFKPNEMITVGSVYTKLEKFLEIAAKQSQAAQAAQSGQTNTGAPGQTQATPNA